jgi:16S rRNA (adenine1518-N6/adenine1519-N6)-dimethyltransferase
MATGSQPTPKKSLGQHWLIDELSLEAIRDLADLQPTDTVLEIGPGTGNLTKLLAVRAQKVTAVELDATLARNLTKLNLANLEIINQDILAFNFDTAPSGYKIVANIPYYLTSKLIRVISETANPPKLAILLVQKEIAERITAVPGDLSILGVTCQYFWDAQKGPLVTADKFDPPPKVDSQVIRLTPKAKLSLSETEQEQLFKLVRIGFAAKRKTILNNLSSGYQIDKPKALEILEGVDIQPTVRPQNISLEQWVRLSQELSSLKLV